MNNKVLQKPLKLKKKLYIRELSLTKNLKSKHFSADALVKNMFKSRKANKLKVGLMLCQIVFMS